MSSNTYNAFKKRKTFANYGTKVKTGAKAAKRTKKAYSKPAVDKKKDEPRRDLNCLRLNESSALGWSASSTFTNIPRVSVYFDSLENRLCSAIDAAHQVVGCAAWLTNDRILTCLSRKSAVSIVVQNDDMGYRAGSKGSGRFQTTQQCKEWTEKLLSRYKSLRGCFIDALQQEATEQQSNGPIAEFLTTKTFWKAASAVRATKRCSAAERDWLQTVYSDDSLETRKKIERGDLKIIGSVRALGERSTQQKSHVARMHHKFFVFFDTEGPYAVWTGSYNPTGMAEQSLENAVLIESREVAASYAAEHAQMLFQSSRLSWSGVSSDSRSAAAVSFVF